MKDYRAELLHKDARHLCRVVNSLVDKGWLVSGLIELECDGDDYEIAWDDKLMKFVIHEPNAIQ
jgi:hypothetical protein